MTILHAQNGIEKIDTSAVSNIYNVILQGTGDITLAHANNIISIAQGSTGTVYGGGEDDVITTNSALSAVYGDNGNDTITGVGDNNDLFYGGRNNDVLLGGAGQDTLYGDEEDDQLNGGSGNDILYGGQGNDILTGGTGADIFSISTFDGNDNITDFSSDDKIELKNFYGLYSIDDIYMIQNGDDTVLKLADNQGGYNSITIENYNKVDLNAENFIFINDATTPTQMDVRWLSDVDFIQTGNGNDRVHGYFSDLDQNDFIDLGAGHDVLEFLTTSFSFDTTDFDLHGIDEIDATNASRARFDLTDNIVATSDTGTLTITYGSNGIERLDTSAVSANYTVDLEGSGDVYLDDFNNNIRLLQNVLGTVMGGAGEDMITSFSSNTTIMAGAGNDILVGKGYSEDIFHGGSGDDLIKGEAGDDLLFGDEGQDIIRGHGGNDTIHGGSGDDLLEGYAGNDTIYGGDDNDQIHGHIGADLLYGGDGDDLIFGQQDNDIIHGGLGNDTLYGGYLYSDGFSSNDLIYGDGGSDTLHGLLGDDILNGGMGDDTLLGGYGNDMLHGDKGNDSIRGGRGNDFIYGGDGDDLVLSGNRGDDTVHGGAGNDIVAGSEGHDFVYGDDGNDIVKGESGNDHVYGNDGDDDVRGHEGHDKLFGGAGNDILTGYSEHDELNGGAGFDILYGQEGWDLFIFDTSAMDGTFDYVMDFNPLFDRGLKFENIFEFNSDIDLISDFVQLTSTDNSQFDLSIRLNNTSPDFTKIAELHNYTIDMGDINSLYDDGKIFIE